MRMKLFWFSCSLLILCPNVATAFCFEEAAAQYHIAPELLKAISRIESNGNPTAIHYNPNGSIDAGHMQINSCWIKKIGYAGWYNLYQPCYNTLVGAWILRECANRYGNTWNAVACYHTGAGIDDAKTPENKEKGIRYVQLVEQFFQIELQSAQSR